MFSTNLSIRLATIFCSYLLYNNASFLQVLSNKASSFIHFLLKIKKPQKFLCEALIAMLHLYALMLFEIYFKFFSFKNPSFLVLLVCFYEFIAKF